MKKKRNKRKSGLEKENSKTHTHSKLKVNKQARIAEKKAKSMTRSSPKAAMAGRRPRGLVKSCGHQSVKRGQRPG